MTPNEYLKKILSQQTLAEGSEELKRLQEHRAHVERLLRDNFDDCSPTIRYAGSKAKGTMIRESYDLDICCYFLNGDTGAGATLEEIYTNTKNALEKQYVVEPKTSALRLKDADPTRRGLDFRIDVVPGRFTDDTKSDVFLYQSAGEKKRLKTNISTHIEHVRDSGVVDAIRLIKLWKVRNGITFKTFVLELLVIKTLSDMKKADLALQLIHVWTEFRDHSDTLTVEDPANPEGNDLTPALDAARATLRSVSSRTLETLESSGWEAVFGAAEEVASSDRAAGLRRAAATVSTPTKPWASDEP